jgi:hypothetical protein
MAYSRSYATDVYCPGSMRRQSRPALEDQNLPEIESTTTAFGGGLQLVRSKQDRRVGLVDDASVPAFGQPDDQY